MLLGYAKLTRCNFFGEGEESKRNEIMCFRIRYWMKLSIYHCHLLVPSKVNNGVIKNNLRLTCPYWFGINIHFAVKRKIIQNVTTLPWMAIIYQIKLLNILVLTIKKKYVNEKMLTRPKYIFSYQLHTRNHTVSYKIPQLSVRHMQDIDSDGSHRWAAYHPYSGLLHW